MIIKDIHMYVCKSRGLIGISLPEVTLQVKNHVWQSCIIVRYQNRIQPSENILFQRKPPFLLLSVAQSWSYRIPWNFLEVTLYKVVLFSVDQKEYSLVKTFCFKNVSLFCAPTQLRAQSYRSPSGPGIGKLIYMYISYMFNERIISPPKGSIGAFIPQ